MQLQYNPQDKCPGRGRTASHPTGWVLHITTVAVLGMDSVCSIGTMTLAELRWRVDTWSLVPKRLRSQGGSWAQAQVSGQHMKLIRKVFLER